MKYKIVKVLDHPFDLYYNPQSYGFHVVFEKDNVTALVGDCCQYVNDSFTGKIRFRIPVEELHRWILLDKTSLLEGYDFISVCPTFNTFMTNKGTDRRRSAWTRKNIKI